MSAFSNIIASVREINRKYAKPEIETTLFVKICLLSLRVYLLAMVGLMIYALVVAAAAGTSPTDTKAAPAPATQPTTQASSAPGLLPAQLAQATEPRS